MKFNLATEEKVAETISLALQNGCEGIIHGKEVVYRIGTEGQSVSFTLPSEFEARSFRNAVNALFRISLMVEEVN